jgi:hypothetical protein
MTKRFTALTMQDNNNDQVDNAGINGNGIAKVNGSSSADKILSRKSFIQQRVEKLYGSQEHTSPKIISYVTRRSTDTLIVTNGITNGHTTNGSQNGSKTEEKENENDENEENLNSLPVMRLLRPEFCKQLQFSSPKKSLFPSSKSNNCVTTTATQMTPTKAAIIKTSYSVDTIERNGNESPEKNVTSFDQNNSSCLENNQNLKNLNLVESVKINSTNCNNNKMVVNDTDFSMENKENCKKNGGEQPNGKMMEEKSAAVKKDGHYFLEILNRERSRLLKMADDVETEMKAIQENVSFLQYFLLFIFSGKFGKIKAYFDFWFLIPGPRSSLGRNDRIIIISDWEIPAFSHQENEAI